MQLFQMYLNGTILDTAPGDGFVLVRFPLVSVVNSRDACRGAGLVYRGIEVALGL